jgi:hypothetical protein
MTALRALRLMRGADQRPAAIFGARYSTAMLALVLAATAALAEPLPVPKPPGPGGSCPHGYIASGWR